MAKILLVYGTTEGHTARVAKHIAETMRAAGHEVDIWESRAARDSVFDGGYDGVIVGGSVHTGQHQSSVREFVQSNRELLEQVPSAFFSVSLSAADHDVEARQETQAQVDKFIRETGWQPRRVETVAGALVYSHYDVAVRQLVRLISRQHGQSTDVAQDYDYTDWEAVATFAREFGEEVNANSRPA